MKKLFLSLPAILSLTLGAAGQIFNASMFTSTDSTFNGIASTMRFADVNGDGYPDMCYAIPTQGQIYCALYSNGTFGTATLWSQDFSSGLLSNCGALSRMCTPTTQWTDPSVWDTIQFVDMDGDHKADVCGRMPAGISSILPKGGFLCRLSTGHDFGGGMLTTEDFNDLQGWLDPSQYETIRIVDIDHDGRPDVCGRNAQGIICDLRHSGFNSNDWSFNPNSGAGYDFCDADPACQVYGFDFGNNLGWNSSPAYWSTIQFADINGDGYPDVCGRGSAGIVCATFNATSHVAVTVNGWPGQARVFDHVGLWTAEFSDADYWNQEQYYSTIRLVDMNGDHKADVCGRGGAGYYCAMSSGSNFQAGVSQTGPGYSLQSGPSVLADNFSDTNGWNQPDHYKKLWIQDVNGDGRPDICGRGSQGIICQVQIGTTGVFAAPSLWVANFGDNFGWGTQTYYWGTVQLVPLPRNGWPNTAFCGHGSAGIWCTSFVPLI
jgi:hypothetical protein